jgi:molybdopterin converting factor small subunit
MTAATGITIELPGSLQPLRGAASTMRIAAACATVGDALAALGDRTPGVVDRVLTEQGAVREHVNVFVGDENIRFLDGLAPPLRDGDTIVIIAAVSGG